MIPQEIVRKKILIIRGHEVMLSPHLAELYGVETRALNQAVKRNTDRFPKDFMFRLNDNETDLLVSQNVIPHRKYFGGSLPYAFTEQGVAMLSSVLNSKRAIQVNIGIMRVFVNIRKVISSNKVVLSKFEQMEKNIGKRFDNTTKTILRAINKPLLPSGSILLSPGKPFSNKKTVRDVIGSCNKYLHWVDKYFSRAGLDWLSESLNPDKIKNVKILMSLEKKDNAFMSLYRDFRKELENDGVKCELRAITDHKLGASIHDRWIISKNLCYNMPSTDTIARGQYSEVKKTANFPPFTEWWEKCKEI